MKKGVSLISLIITIIVLIILSSITIFNSLNTVDEAQTVKMEKEFNDVCDFVRSISTKAEAGMLELNLSGDTLATESQLATFYVNSPESEFTAEDQQNIFSFNESGRDPNYGYHYITGNQIENGISGIDVPSNLDGVINNYIINFYYGTVVAKVSSNKTCISGKVK